MTDLPEKEITPTLPEKETMLAVTVSPPPAMQHFTFGRKKWSKSTIDFAGYHDRKIAFIEEWTLVFDNFIDRGAISTYEMHLELSRGGLLHWHGTMTLDDPEVFYHMMGTLKHLYGFQGLEYNPVSDEQQWRRYIEKDQGFILTPGVKKPTIIEILSRRRV